MLQKKQPTLVSTTTTDTHVCVCAAHAVGGEFPVQNVVSAARIAVVGALVYAGNPESLSSFFLHFLDHRRICRCRRQVVHLGSHLVGSEHFDEMRVDLLHLPLHARLFRRDVAVGAPWPREVSHSGLEAFATRDDVLAALLLRRRTTC